MTDFEEEMKAWGERNLWFSNPQTELELDMARDAMQVHVLITQEMGSPANAEAVERYLSLIDKAMRDHYPEYGWEQA
jgi:hypothetical protein